MKRLNLFLVALLVCTLAITPSAFAATGYSGYAVGRKGVNPSGHNALSSSGTLSGSNAVIHIIDTTSGVKYDSWNNFIYDPVLTFYGVFKPNSNPNGTQRDQILLTAIKLTTRGSAINYTLLGQIDYPGSVMNKTKVEPSDITAVRCDGVVEYCNEYNGHRISGNAVFWDISIPTYDHLNQHILATVTPHTQLTNMTQVYFP